MSVDERDESVAGTAGCQAVDVSDSDLSPEESVTVETVATWVDREVRPQVRDLERSDTYPGDLIDQIKAMGVFGLTIPEPWGESAVSGRSYARVTEEIARGWMSLAGAFGGHSVVSKLIARHGTPEQRDRYLPRMATGELRATMALTEPDGGSDLQAMRTVARPTTRDGVDGYVISGAKTWITNARTAGVVALLCKTDPAAEPRHRGVSILLVEKVPGFTVGRNLPKLGYKGVESCELSFDDCFVPADALLGGVEGEGFTQMMGGLEIGRIQVAGRAIGVARAAFDDALAYARQREAFGKPMWQHQSVGNLLADIATRISAARRLNYHAAECYDSGGRADMEASMAKLFCSEMAAQVTLDAIRIHGGHGYSTEFDVERYYRDAPLMIVGEGTNEILRNVIVRQIIERDGLG